MQWSPDQRDRYLFMLAARWDDDIRNNKDFDHPAWHYIDIPIVDPADEGKIEPSAPGPQNVVTAIETNAKAAADGEPAEKAVAICWLMHLVGDVHQPLHAAEFYSSKWPKGDRGGNEFWIRAKAGSGAINLHSFGTALSPAIRDIRASATLRRRCVIDLR